MAGFSFAPARFAAQDLERSAPFDPLRRLRGAAGEALVAALWSRLETPFDRRRNWRPADRERLGETLDALLANVAIAAFNRVDPNRFVAVSFNINHYAGSTLSHTALRQLREALASLDLLEGQSGFRHTDAFGKVHARRTRLRATAELRAFFVDVGLGRGNVGWAHQRDLISLKAPDSDVPPEPADVIASRSVLAAVNARIAGAELSLPDTAWARVAERYRVEPDNADEVDRPLAGDVTAETLYRGFKGGWDRGGRLYGGWWINLPRVERAQLTVDGSQVVELDYGRLHPTLLFARSGHRLDFDPYVMPGVTGPGARELGKRTFNRLLNRKPLNGGRDVRLGPTALDRAQLPIGWSFRSYLDAFIARLAPVADWFGTGEGLRLQREDSDLAVDVLGRLLIEDVVALPVHDSFIVKQQDEATLRRAMNDAFEHRYGFAPLIR